MKRVQNGLLDFILSESDNQEDFNDLEKLFNNLKIQSNIHKLKSTLCIIAKISNNHHRFPNFFEKIELIINLLSKDMTQYLSNYEIFHIFKGNKRILLFLFESKIISFDEQVFNKIMSAKYVKFNYHQYFSPEITEFVSNVEISKKHQEILMDIPNKFTSDFYENRKKGENENLICQLIRKDDIEQFIIKYNENCFKLDALIENSIFETNKYLMERLPNIFEYSAFYGAIQILKYLLYNNIEIPINILLYAIHSNNPEVICLFEEKEEEDRYNRMFLFEKCFKESIKCHHNDLANHYLDDLEEDNLDYVSDSLFNYYNFDFMKSRFIKESKLLLLCKKDYYYFIANLLSKEDIDLNQIIRDIEDGIKQLITFM